MLHGDKQRCLEGKSGRFIDEVAAYVKLLSVSTKSNQIKVVKALILTSNPFLSHPFFFGEPCFWKSAICGATPPPAGDIWSVLFLRPHDDF